MAQRGAAGSEGHELATATRRARRRTLLLGGLLPFDTSRLPADAIAGATLAALAIPEVMGYTSIAGTPVITGLYTLLLPILAFAIFLVIKAMNTAKKRFEKQAVTAAPPPAPPDVVLLSEIRDILKRQRA